MLRLWQGFRGVSDKAKKKTAFQMVGVVFFMGAMAWASVPFYDWFCRVTGFGGITQVADSSSGIVLNETVKVRFDASEFDDTKFEGKFYDSIAVDSILKNLFVLIHSFNF